MNLIKKTLITTMFLMCSSSINAVRMPIIDLLTTFDCVHENLTTGEIDYYGIVDGYFDICPIYQHEPSIKKSKKSNNISQEVYNSVIWEGTEHERGYPAQPIHPNDTPEDHECKFGLKQQVPF